MYLTTKAPTEGQREILKSAAESPCFISGDTLTRIAEQLQFRKWATLEGSLMTGYTVHITDAGRKAILIESPPKRKKRKLKSI